MGEKHPQRGGGRTRDRHRGWSGGRKEGGSRTVGGKRKGGGRRRERTVWGIRRRRMRVKGWKRIGTH